MAEGTIKTIRDDKGFGFIRPSDGSKDIFFHASVVQDTLFDQLREGDQVTYPAGPDQRDPGRMRAEFGTPARLTTPSTATGRRTARRRSPSRSARCRADGSPLVIGRLDDKPDPRCRP